MGNDGNPNLEVKNVTEYFMQVPELKSVFIYKN